MGVQATVRLKSMRVDLITSTSNVQVNVILLLFILFIIYMILFQLKKL